MPIYRSDVGTGRFLTEQGIKFSSFSCPLFLITHQQHSAELTHPSSIVLNIPFLVRNAGESRGMELVPAVPAPGRTLLNSHSATLCPPGPSQLRRGLSVLR